MEVVCLQEEAFYKLFDKVIEHLNEKLESQPRQWIDGVEAMDMLNISSKTTLQKLRDTGKIRFSQPQPRIILYDRHSINAYIESHAKDTF
ncbi:MAG: helix-turn-helix domain-containing protein [Bacteroidota bacterium]